VTMQGTARSRSLLGVAMRQEAGNLPCSQLLRRNVSKLSAALLRADYAIGAKVSKRERRCDPASPTSPKHSDPHVPVVDERCEGKADTEPEGPTRHPTTAASRLPSPTNARNAHDVADGIFWDFRATVGYSSTSRKIFVPSIRSAPG
jgi:hypothetical protein